MTRLSLVVLIFTVLAGNAILAEETETGTGQEPVRKFVLIDGTELVGRVVGQNGDMLQILLLSGETRSVFAQDILSQNVGESIVGKDAYRVVRGEAWGKNPNRTRHFLSPSSLPLNKGEGYLSQTELVITSYVTGLTDNVTILAASAVPFLVKGPDTFNLAGGVKMADKLSENLHVSAGAAVGVAGENALAVPFAGFTVGQADKQCSLNIGALFHRFDTDEEQNNDDQLREEEGDYDWEEEGDGVTPIFSISGMWRVTKSSGLVIENLFFPDLKTPDSGWGILSGHFLAIRRLGLNTSWDLGFFFFSGDEFGGPWFEYMWHF